MGVDAVDLGPCLLRDSLLLSATPFATNTAAAAAAALSHSSCTSDRAADRAERYIRQQSTIVSYASNRGETGHTGVAFEVTAYVLEVVRTISVRREERSQKKDSTELYRRSRTLRLE
jgi:hypothetical protein